MRTVLPTVLSASVGVLLLAAPASAHVTVQGPGATQGGYTKMTFRVPTEKDIATTALQIVFPADAPLASARVKPHAGWTAVIAKAKPVTALTDGDGNSVDEVVSSITWTAAKGAGIGPTEFDEFEVSAGPLPKVDQMVFKALQTYADGSVVRWIEAPGSDHPAPVLPLAPAADAGHSAHGGSPAPSVQPSVQPSTAAVSVTAEESADDSGRVLGALAVGLAILALLGSGVAVVRSGRR